VLVMTHLLVCVLRVVYDLVGVMVAGLEEGRWLSMISLTCFVFH